MRSLYGADMRSHDAFQRLCQVYAKHGRRIDELDFYEPDESKRFFRKLIQGANGHVFWNGGAVFTCNGGSTRKPLHWWWEHLYGTRADKLVLECGQSRCVNPRHARPFQRERLYPDHVIIGALQVWGLRHGRPPSMRSWDGSPSHAIIKLRFGSWRNALQAAGFPASDYNRYRSPEECIAALRFVFDLTGKWPTWESYLGAHDELQANDYPTRPNTIKDRFGSWAAAIEAAKQ